MTRPSIEGEERRPNDPAERRRAIDEAVDYRGDVTLDLADGTSVTGFVFNADPAPDPAWIELFPTGDGTDKQRLPARDLRAIRFSGRDTADGRSWEAWAAKHEKKDAPKR